MSRQFGGASTDSIVTGLTAHATIRSYSFWAYPTGSGGGSNGRVFDKRTASAQVELVNYRSDNLWGYERDWSTVVGQWKSTSTITLNAWTHVVITYDGTSTSNSPSLYLNGTSDTFVAVSTPSGSLLTNTDAYVIGNRTNDNLRNWAGNLCEVAVWSGIQLNSTDVTNLHNGVSPLVTQSGSLVAYWPLRCGNSAEPDLTGSTSAATVNGTTFVPSNDPATPLPCPKIGLVNIGDVAVKRAALI